MNGAPYTLTSGEFQGAGTLTGDLMSVGGDVAPGGSGSHRDDQRHRQLHAGHVAASMTIELASAASYDILAATGTTTLDGTLNVSLIGGYLPLNGDVLQPHTFASRTGDFATKNLPTWAAGHGSISPSYTPTALVLTAVVTPLSTDLSAGMTGPTTINAAQPLSYGITITNNGPIRPQARHGRRHPSRRRHRRDPATAPAGPAARRRGGTITCTNTTSITSGGQLASADDRNDGPGQRRQRLEQRHRLRRRLERSERHEQRSQREHERRGAGVTSLSPRTARTA